MPSIDINIDSVIVLTAKLESMRKKALPTAVKNTLNAAALDVKQVTMPEETDRDFIKRQPTFWKATSRVEFAKGNSINDMAAIVGFMAPASVKESGHATTDLQQQESSGNIDKRAFIALDKARTGKGNVKGAYRMKQIKGHIVDAKNEEGANQGEQFIKAAVKAGRGNFVIMPWTNRKGNKMLARITGIKKRKRGDYISYDELYSVRATRKVHVKPTNFMAEAAAQSSKKLERIFIEQTNMQIDKILR